MMIVLFDPPAVDFSESAGVWEVFTCRVEVGKGRVGCIAVTCET